MGSRLDEIPNNTMKHFPEQKAVSSCQTMHLALSVALVQRQFCQFCFGRLSAEYRKHLLFNNSSQTSGKGSSNSDLFCHPSLISQCVFKPVFVFSRAITVYVRIITACPTGSSTGIFQCSVNLLWIYLTPFLHRIPSTEQDAYWYFLNDFNKTHHEEGSAEGREIILNKWREKVSASLAWWF